MRSLEEQLTLGLPEPYGLYRPAAERDSCGVGFICDIKGRASNRIIRDAEHIFGSHFSAKMNVFNVVVANSRGSFFADFTVPSDSFTIPIPVFSDSASADISNQSRHTYFLRVKNSYNKTMPIKIEIGICRWICRNGIIFDKHSIVFKDSHSKPKHELVDQIAIQAERLNVRALPSIMADAYRVPLCNGVSILEGVCQTLQLTIPEVNALSRTARLWKDRCKALIRICHQYQEIFGLTTYSVLQAASEWAQHRIATSPIQRDSYERRCGQMIETISQFGRWPNRNQNTGQQVGRVVGWSEI